MTAGAADWMTRVESKILFKCPLHSFSVAVPERNRPVAKRLGVTLVVRTGCEKFYAQRKSKRLLGQPERRCDPSVRPAYDLRSDAPLFLQGSKRTTCDQTSFVVMLSYDLRSDVVCRHVVTLGNANAVLDQRIYDKRRLVCCFLYQSPPLDSWQNGARKVRREEL
jgi:hypothetical protein